MERQQQSVNSCESELYNLNIYYFFFLSIFITSILSLMKETKIFATLLTIYSLALMFVLSGMRSIEVGYDTIGHKFYFDRVANNFTAIFESREVGYSFLSYLVSLIGDFRHFIVVISIILLVLLLLTVKYFSPNYTISIFAYSMLYFLGNNIAKLRAAIAVLLLIYSIKFIHKSNYGLFLVTVLIATSFHNSAIFFIIFLPLSKFKLTRIRMVTISMVSAFIGFSGIGAWLYLNYYSILGRLNINLANALSYYADASDAIRKSGGYLGLAYIILSFFVLLFFTDIFYERNQTKAIILSKVYFWGIVFFFLFNEISIIRSRLTMPFLMAEVFLLPYFLDNIKSKNYRLIFFLIYASAIFLKGIAFFNNNYDSFVPFRFFFN